MSSHFPLQPTSAAHSSICNSFGGTVFAERAAITIQHATACSAVALQFPSGSSTLNMEAFAIVFVVTPPLLSVSLTGINYHWATILLSNPSGQPTAKSQNIPVPFLRSPKRVNCCRLRVSNNGLLASADPAPVSSSRSAPSKIAEDGMHYPDISLRSMSSVQIFLLIKTYFSGLTFMLDCFTGSLSVVSSESTVPVVNRPH